MRRDRCIIQAALPEGNSYISVAKSFYKPDDTKLRFLPYFGENDDLRVDTAAYDNSDDDSDSELDEDTKSVVKGVVRARGDSDAVVAAIAQVVGVMFHQVRDFLRTQPVPVSQSPLDSFEALFCRRCYIYNCNLHPIDQPRLRRRRFPDENIAGPILTQCRISIPSNPCSDQCFLSKGCNSVLTPVLSDMEISTFRKLVFVFGTNWCSVASALSSRLTCAEVAALAGKFAFAQVDVAEKPVDSSKKRSGQAVVSRLFYKTFGKVLQPYDPCDHPGPCSSSIYCSCLNQGHFCDKFCGCDQSCRRRFTGCKCSSEKLRCQTRRCPCFAAGRECDIDLCGVCDMGGGSASSCGNGNIASFHKTEPILLGRSAVHGFGAFAAKNVAKGELISEYVGEMISQDEADRRGQTYDKRDCSYLFDVNSEYVVDACFKGNKVKYANHSETPNCFARIVYARGDHRIGIFAKRDIVQGEELSFHYNHKNGAGAPKWFSNHDG
uniref:Uncharacterized protein n=1 Tax=Spongospora subterranea TaxID=70186 RepID=A0A0H5RBE0_9EUKA|eukprot:CRZ10937.1 hypothetical protein [Spongospora subterranea]